MAEGLRRNNEVRDHEKMNPKKLKKKKKNLIQVTVSRPNRERKFIFTFREDTVSLL